MLLHGIAARKSNQIVAMQLAFVNLPTIAMTYCGGSMLFSIFNIHYLEERAI